MTCSTPYRNFLVRNKVFINFDLVLNGNCIIGVFFINYITIPKEQLSI